MSDLADNADAVIAVDLAEAINKSKQYERLAATGYCHYCASSVRSSELFCDAYCRDDYEHQRAAKLRNGTA